MKRYRGILVLVILGIALISGGALVRRGLVAASPVTDGARLFEQVAQLVQEKYIDSVSTEELYRSAVDGMLRELGDPHTSYLAPRRLDRLTESTTGNYGGLGIEVDAREEGITVVAPLPGGPAEAAGIVTGDRITAVEGASTRGWTVDEASRALRGTPGTKISITVERPGVAVPLPFTLTRREVHRQAIRRAVILQNDIGYVDVDIFSGATAAELERAKNQVRAGTLLSLDDIGSRMNRLARSLLYHGRVIPLEELVARVEALTLEDCRRAADRLFAKGEFAFAAIGPFRKPKRKRQTV